jgi:hypothetical protein
LPTDDSNMYHDFTSTEYDTVVDDDGNRVNQGA